MLCFTLESAADRTRFPASRLQAWEAGAEQPTIPQLRTLANAYRRPLSAFFMMEPPPDFEPMRDFRRLPEADEPRWSPAFRALIRRVRAQQRIFASLISDAGDDRPMLVPAPDSDDPEAVATFARAQLGVTIRKQQSWRDEGTALRGWTRAIEELGILTLYTSTARGQTISPDEMLGFSEPDPVPTIVLNGSDQVRRRTFTLLHEYAHLLLRVTGVCDLHDRFTTPNFDPTEVFCNAVAAAILMPREAFLADPGVEGKPTTREWSDAELGQIARRFTTSREAVLRRLLTFDLTTEEYYRSWRERYYGELRSAEDETSGGGFANYYQMKVRELGVPYINAVLDSYHRDAINTSDLLRYLNVKARSLQGVEEELLRNQARAS
jgi:Zn-dependent peptidase ImmA (M78 family)